MGVRTGPGSGPRGRSLTAWRDAFSPLARRIVRAGVPSCGALRVVWETRAGWLGAGRAGRQPAPSGVRRLAARRDRRPFTRRVPDGVTARLALARCGELVTAKAQAKPSRPARAVPRPGLAVRAPSPRQTRLMIRFMRFSALLSSGPSSSSWADRLNVLVSVPLILRHRPGHGLRVMMAFAAPARGIDTVWRRRPPGLPAGGFVRSGAKCRAEESPVRDRRRRTDAPRICPR